MKSTDSSGALSPLTSDHIRNWFIAGIMAISLNILLFLLLPVLIHPPPKSTGIIDHITRIQVIRLKKEDTPVHKKKRPPPKPPPQKPKKKPAQQLRPTARLTLPFKLNTRLPSVSTDFQLPLADTIAFGDSIRNGLVDMGKLDRPLTPAVRIPPVYPIRARRKGIEGWVRVGFEVDKGGKVRNLRILAAKPENIFEKSVLRCVARWQFKPGTVEGVPVRARMETTIRFKME